MRKMGKFIVAISGGSGGLYAIKVCESILANGDELFLVTSEPGRRVLSLETSLNLSGNTEKDLKILLDKFGNKYENQIHIHHQNDVGASIASGSFKTDGMVIVPCSTGTLGSIANGISRGLIERAADVVLKERRKLIIVPRETPLSIIHLKNMVKLTEAGGIVMPASPGFYHIPNSVDDLVNMVASRVLQHLEIESPIIKPWKGEN